MAFSFEPGLDVARSLDREDPLARFRGEFFFPKQESGEPYVYLCGNSLGLQPKGAERYLSEELHAWRDLAVEGHFKGPRPWYDYHEFFTDSVARLVGAKPVEVVVMNGLTVNLHLLMASFYRPTKERYRILIEESAFPSDRYAVRSQARFHGFTSDDAVIEFGPREGEDVLRTEDLERFLEEEGHSIALILMGGVNFYSGQAYDIPRITQAGHAAGCAVAFDLAHAAGNLALQLHEWDVDFAAWCTYKYLNAGPGATACAFVHERFQSAPELPRFAGWWGTDPKTRFQMASEFQPQPGAAGWQLSNAPVFSMAPLRASLDVFDAAGIEALRAKAEKLSAYLMDLTDRLGDERVQVITPRDPAARGCQVSLRLGERAHAVNDALTERGVICDYRRPDVIRVAPVPLYNSFEDVWRFVEVLREVLDGE